MQLTVKVFKYLKRQFLAFLYRTADYLVPKIDNLVIFSQIRSRYSDNARALFEYMSGDPAWQIIWLADNLYVQQQMKESLPESRVILRKSSGGLWVSLRARYAIITHGLGDLEFYQYKSRKKYIIQLWHAITVKSIGILDSQLDRKLLKKYIRRETRHYDLVIASSDIERYLVAAYANIDVRKVVVTGLPRNDFLCNSNSSTNSVARLDETLRQGIKGKKVILYAPTFRDSGATKFFPFDDFKISELEQFLSRHNAVLLIRPHQDDFKNQETLSSLVNSSSGDFLLAGSNEVPETADLLPFVDVIITDYSSIYIDLLLRDIPPIFVPYDLETYQKVRGLAYDYDLITPGPKIFTQAELLKATADALNGAPNFAEHRAFVKKMFHKYTDGRACERVVEALKQLPHLQT